MAGAFFCQIEWKALMVYSLRESQQFVSDLQNLDPVIRKRANKSLKQLESDPYYPGLDSHAQDSIHGRKAMRSRVNENFRILWEWSEGGVINLWRVAKHDVIDARSSLPTEAGANWKMYRRNEADGSAEAMRDWREDLRQPQPFRNVPENHLRLFGVPDEQLSAVKALNNPEELWDMPLAENVQYTLYNVLEMAEDWTADELLDTRQLLYRATADQLEGYCEGKIKKLLLNLNDEQERFVNLQGNGPILIKGVAGSGKTTIGLYRAHRLAQAIEQRGRMFGEDTAVLLLTYSTTLTKALQQLYLELYGEDLPYSITVEPFKEWMLKLLQKTGLRLNAAERQTRRQLVDEAKLEVVKAFPNDRVVSQKYSQFLLDEFDKVIRSRRINSLTEYQAVDRIGRGSALDRQRHRPIVWEIYQRYQKKLDEASLFDWSDLARLAQKHYQPLPQFDVVIVDEAQDLPPSDLHLATQLIPNYSGMRGLTLLADPAQSIYYRGIPWKEAGINIQGRTHILAKNFRNTQQILEAARHIVEGCEDLKAAEEYIPPSSTRRSGPKPVKTQYSNYEASTEFVIREIVKLCQKGKYRPGDVAILSRKNEQLTILQRRLRQEHISCAMFRADGFHIFENDVKLITMHSAKGLEFPVVFMIALSDDNIPFIHRYTETRDEDELRERKLFYVSMTRAAERLYLLHPRRNRCRFLHDIDEPTVRQDQC